MSFSEPTDADRLAAYRGTVCHNICCEMKYRHRVLTLLFLVGLCVLVLVLPLLR